MGKIDLFADKDGAWVKIADMDGVRIVEKNGPNESGVIKFDISKEYKFNCEMDSDVVTWIGEVSEITKWLRELGARSLRIENGKYIVTWKDGTETEY